MSLARELEDVLTAEQECLLSGDYAGLEQLADRKSHLADRLGSAKGLEVDEMRRLAVRAVRNEALLKSARKGIRSAMAQLEQLSNGEYQSTYSKDGARRPLSRPSSSMIRKL